AGGSPDPGGPVREGPVAVEPPSATGPRTIPAGRPRPTGTTAHAPGAADAPRRLGLAERVPLRQVSTDSAVWRQVCNVPIPSQELASEPVPNVLPPARPPG